MGDCMSLPSEADDDDFIVWQSSGGDIQLVLKLELPS